MKTSWALFIEELPFLNLRDVWYEQDYFIFEELVPESVFKDRGDKILELMHWEPLVTLIELRILLDSPITINNWSWVPNGLQYRGWRPPQYYKGKESCSQHILFNAFDFSTREHTPAQIRERIRMWKQEGKLRYLTGLEKDTPTWTHFDCRHTDRLDDDGLFIFGA